MHLHDHLRTILRHLPAGDVDHDRHAHSLRGLPLVQEFEGLMQAVEHAKATGGEPPADTVVRGDGLLAVVHGSTLAFHRHAASAGPLSAFAEDSERTIRELMARHGYKVQ
jgi:hypothetical protein